jgi:hypothetical protein
MKDVYTVFSEKLAEVDAAGKREQFNERAANLTSVEAKINCANFLLGTTVKESKGRAPKNNGRSENFVENNPFNEGRSKGGTASTSVREDKLTKSKERLCESLIAKGTDPREARAFVGLKEPLPEGLNERQLAEYTFARRCGISESDSMTLAKMPLRTR